jgi:hypothetical protein
MPGYVLNTDTTDGHQSINNGDQCNSNIQTAATDMSHNTETHRPAFEGPNDTQTPRSAAIIQPVDTKVPQPALDFPFDTQMSRPAVERPIDTQTASDYLLASELLQDVYQRDCRNVNTNNQPNNTENQNQASRGNSGDHLPDSEQIMNYVSSDTNFSELMDGYVPNNTESQNQASRENSGDHLSDCDQIMDSSDADFSELMDGYVPHGTMDLPVMGDGPNDSENKEVSASDSESHARSDNQDCFGVKPSDDSPAQLFSSQDAEANASDKSEDTNNYIGDVSSASNQDVRQQSPVLSSNVSSEDRSSGDVEVNCDSPYIPVSALLQK